MNFLVSSFNWSKILLNRGNWIAERFMAVSVKLVHAAMAEKKDLKLEIERRLMQYRNIPNPSTGKTSSELIINSIVCTELLTMGKTMNIGSTGGKRKDKQEKL